MKIGFVIFVCLCCLSGTLFSQSQLTSINGFDYDTSRLNAVVRTIKLKETNLDKIIHTIDTNCSTDQQKVYCIYQFITSQFKYDLTRFKLIQKGKVDRELYMNELMKKHKGVCGDFANLFKTMCDSLAIPSFRVSGYTKTFRIFHPVHKKRTDHAWNVVRIDGKWYPVDATWGIRQFSEKKYNRKQIDYSYLLADIVTFSKRHHPLDPTYQLTNQQRSYSDFRWSRKSEKAHIYQTVQPDSILNERLRLNRKEQVMEEYVASVKYLKKGTKSAAGHVIRQINQLTDKKNPTIKKLKPEHYKSSIEWYESFAEASSQFEGRLPRRIGKYARFMKVKQEKALEKLGGKK